MPNHKTGKQKNPPKPKIPEEAVQGERHLDGDAFWQLSAGSLRNPRKFHGADDLLNALCGYFDWMKSNPLQEAKLVSFQGDSELQDTPKMRAPTLQSLCLYLGIARDTWGCWRRGQWCPEVTLVVNWAEDMMYALKFEAAAGGLLNPNIIARDLGLAERTELTGRDGEPIKTQLDVTKLDSDTMRKLLAARVDNG